MPGAGVDLGAPAWDPTTAGYEAKAALTDAALAHVVPGVLDVMGARGLTIERTVGGYEGLTSPSVLARGPLRDPEATAAALGWVLAQSSVLVIDPTGAGAGWASVRLPERPTFEVASALYRRAIEVSPVLTGGFTAIDRDLVFINLRGDDGAPLSGVGDEAFAGAV
ncbi:MAG TPA: hypothetical protein PKA64_20355, partial [Myxococcota bacterium]|nr:hypothetical protein [Myxococcota bacterium]